MSEAKPSAPAGSWYAEGLRFECQQTGRCCTNHGDHAYVYVTPDDETKLAKHLKLTKAAFRRTHTRILDGHRILRDGGSSCHLLDGHGCSVYEARPVQCRTWPFWHSNLDPEVWQREVVPFCAGAGRGRLYSKEEIDTIADQHRED